MQDEKNGNALTNDWNVKLNEGEIKKKKTKETDICISVSLNVV